MITDNCHIPVMLEEVTQVLFEQTEPNQEIRFFDGTLGGGGYTQKFLNHAQDNNIKLHQFSGDLDKEAIDRVNSYITVPQNQELTIKQGNFADLINDFDDNSLDGIVADLGFSSNQLSESDRGFSYLKPEQILDLRYDTNTGLSASDKIIRIKNYQDLSKIIYDNSGEDLANKIAKKILDTKEKQEWTVQKLVDVVISCIPPTAMRKKNQILSRVWQSLRIWVNDEFISLDTFLEKSLLKLKPNGRLVIVSFHSLEDKMVTNFFRKQSKPATEDIYGNKTYKYKLITSKGIAPSEEEVQKNVRSRSAILRVIQKL
jgi:16S rRNA (cytosine1402-N4)-methyltransferase